MLGLPVPSDFPMSLHHIRTSLHEMKKYTQKHFVWTDEWCVLFVPV